ncbi:hypothetical protein DFS33DRAFT_993191 [Desarmillaria ectypa]|nr:hypothetical protein DFS33DRAFT_993191 [Desarmillaria ectypa]
MSSDELAFSQHGLLENASRASKRPFQFNLALQTSTPQSRSHRHPQKAHIFAPALRHAKPPANMFLINPEQPKHRKSQRMPYNYRHNIQSPTAQEEQEPTGMAWFIRDLPLIESLADDKKKSLTPPVFKMFSQSSKRPFADSHASQLSTPAHQSGSKSLELPQTPISERFEPHSQHSSVQPEVAYHGDEANWEENMMIRKMREASAIKAQLADEREVTLSLKGELAAAQNADVVLKQKFVTLESENERQAVQIQSLTEKMSQTKLELFQVAEEQERTVNLMQDKVGEVERLRSELLHAGEKYAVCEERAGKIKDAAKKGMVHLSRGHAYFSFFVCTLISASLCRYESLKTTFDELKLRFDVSQDNLQRTKDEIELLKSTSGRQIKLVESHLDESGRYLHKSAETRDLISELQQDRNSSQQVNDILREKLHSLSAQLVESKQKIAELELRQFEEGARWSRRGETWQNLQYKIEELADKLAKREGEAFEGLIENANLSTALNEAIEKHVLFLCG